MNAFFGTRYMFYSPMSMLNRTSVIIFPHKIPWATIDLSAFSKETNQMLAWEVKETGFQQVLLQQLQEAHKTYEYRLLVEPMQRVMCYHYRSQAKQREMSCTMTWREMQARTVMCTRRGSLEKRTKSHSENISHWLKDKWEDPWPSSCSVLGFHSREVLPQPSNEQCRL